jgi:hypothetical protein
MGKTYRQPAHKFDDDRTPRKGKNPSHSNGRKLGGMRIINDIYDENDDYLDDEVNITDHIVINKYSDDNS